MEDSKVDTTAQLPYRVPVDVLIRSLQVIRLLIGLYLLYVGLSDLKNPHLIVWGLGILLTLNGVFRQFHSSGLVWMNRASITPRTSCAEAASNGKKSRRSFPEPRITTWEVFP